MEKEMAGQIARDCVLSLHSTKPDGEWDVIVRQGESDLLMRSRPNQFEYTEIVEVRRDG